MTQSMVVVRGEVIEEYLIYFFLCFLNLFRYFFHNHTASKNLFSDSFWRWIQIWWQQNTLINMDPGLDFIKTQQQKCCLIKSLYIPSSDSKRYSDYNAWVPDKIMYHVIISQGTVPLSICTYFFLSWKHWFASNLVNN